MSLDKNSPFVPAPAGGPAVARPREATMGDRIDAIIRGLLVDGEFAPGEKLSLRRLSDMLGVSIMPVRGAIARLQSDGALEVSPSKAVRVPLMSIKEFRQITLIRAEIEGFAAEKAADNCIKANLYEIAEMEARMQILCHSWPFRTAAAVQANRELHFAIYRAAGLQPLVDIIERLWLRIGPVLFHRDGHPSVGPEAKLNYRDVVKALFERNGSAARAAIVEEIRRTADLVTEVPELAAGRLRPEAAAPEATVQPPRAGREAGSPATSGAAPAAP